MSWHDPTIPPLTYGKVHGQNGEERPQKRPEISVTDRPLQELIQDGYEALIASNDPPVYFRRGMVLVRLTHDDGGRPLLRAVDQTTVRLRLAQIADWTRETKDETKTTHPPSVIASTLVSIADDLTEIPLVDQIVTAPVFGPDGALILDAGYTPAARLIYEPTPGFEVPHVSPDPTQVELAQARRLIVDDLLGDFPFVGEPERAHAVAMVLQPFVRPMIAGATPLFLLEAPTPGTGKGLLSDVTMLPALGSTLPAMAEGRDDDEWRKRITSSLLAGRPTIRIDNVTRPIDSGALAMALTEPVWQDRILGASRDVLIPIRCTWIMTGNNPALTTEIARRSVRIRLDPKVERPWLTNDHQGRSIEYRHEDLRLWALEHRDELVWAALTLVSAWLANGQPGSEVKLGSYEVWSDVIGGILKTAGIPGFLGNLEDFYDKSDAERDALAVFLADWWEEFGSKVVTAADLLRIGNRYLDLGGGTHAELRKRLGLRLAGLRDTVLGDFRVESAGKDRGKRQTYVLARHDGTKRG